MTYRWPLAALALSSLVGCYRERATPLTNVGEPMVLAEASASACGPDDLQLPVVDSNPDGRLRTHTSGSLAGAGRRTWVGPVVPEDVPTTVGTMELFLADDADDGILALYRDPYDVGSCGLGGKANCAYEARYYRDDGQLAWALPLAGVLSRPDGLEIQDIRLAGGVLYFNEACQSYSDGRCSSLVAVQPREARVLWRTPPVVSNGRFRLRGCYIIAGYGFTAEPDHVSVVERGSGRIVQTIPVSSSPERLALIERDRLDVTLYSGATRRYRLDGFDRGPASLVSLDPPEAIYGGAGYGGYGYGGYGYGGASYGGYGGASYGMKPPPPPPRPSPPRRIPLRRK